MKRIDKNTALKLFKTSDLLELGEMADSLRRSLHPEEIVTFIIDRNINYTNVCINKCKFCAFYREEDSPDAYVLDRDVLYQKIRETIELGGTQILIQGGLNPALGINYYVELLQAIKENFNIHIHGFSPPEIYYMADNAGYSVKKTIEILKKAGLDSIPGGGAEILSDRIREQLSPKKIGKDKWLKVMEEAHCLGMKTTATMMFGSIEEPEDIIEHLDAIRTLQNKTQGFTAFIPWSFQPGNTELSQNSEVRSEKSGEKSQISNLKSQIYSATAVEYLRVLALSRIYLDNVPNIQASWVTQGVKMAQIALRFGANDFGSTMIEENVVAAAGVSYKISIDEMIDAIRNSGFKPCQRDMYYNVLKEFLVSHEL
ncbi:MAG: dehypoxanthine futalosine cyclase [Nitrospirae bacterium]|nr:dehypoxanthine futalosine cyclase [Nitrospirota bacterium]